MQFAAQYFKLSLCSSKPVTSSDIQGIGTNDDRILILKQN